MQGTLLHEAPLSIFKFSTFNLYGLILGHTDVFLETVLLYLLCLFSNTFEVPPNVFCILKICPCWWYSKTAPCDRIQFHFLIVSYIESCKLRSLIGSTLCKILSTSPPHSSLPGSSRTLENPTCTRHWQDFLPGL